MSADCPCCLVLSRFEALPLCALTLGVALGNSFSDIDAVAELVCANHRLPYFMSMARAAVAMREEPQPVGTGGAL